jgi:hypothetical protein
MLSVTDIAEEGRAAMQAACASGDLIRRSILLVFHNNERNGFLIHRRQPGFAGKLALGSIQLDRDMKQATSEMAHHLAVMFRMIVSVSRTTSSFSLVFSLSRLSSACLSWASRSTSLKQ